MKVFFRRIHLYLSLAAGLVILIACLTGAILVFQKEAEQTFHHDRYFIQPSGQRLALEQIVEGVKKQNPQSKINGIKVYSDPERSIEVSIGLGEKGKQGKDDHKGSIANQETGNKEKPPSKNESEQGHKAGAKRAEGRGPGLIVFVNPYTGKVLETYNNRESFFFTVMSLHRWLLGGNDSIGKYIMGISTFIFLFILITGIILWWPRTRKILVQRLKIKSNAGWKRINHDLHLLLGFYSSIFLFIFAFTAMAWSFEWFNNGIYKVTNSPIKSPEPPKSIYQNNVKRIGFDAVYQAAQTVYRNVVFYNISAPKDSVSAFTVMALSNYAVHESATDAVYIDQYSGKILEQQLFSDRSLGARVRSTFRPVHTGSIWGMPSKIIAFLVCLMGISFPITGVIMWLNRTRKKEKVKGKRILAEMEA
ncbi:PepSY domain-containing protein [Chitinophagaceae bacterium LB-8]|uniref:PepSY domain-containing protein n=1 Tax=Paraflavisolibacter caeni TaxID=2982496 RepID=A0A9X2Y091_9BACT|nr:PepSY-associated TM helix domain-containing protein [Paraflavisolibacter caeni]MCU7552731.1 PepSY domain-containing protein [Paraflavisolibacter caeni]